MSPQLSELDRLAIARPLAASMTEVLVSVQEREAILASITSSKSVDVENAQVIDDQPAGARVIGAHSTHGSRIPRRVLVALLLVALVGTITVIETRVGATQRLFPLGSHAAAPNTGPGVKRSWHLTSVIAHQIDAENQIADEPAAMLSCATTMQCFAISDPPTIAFTSAPDYLMDLGAGFLDVSGDGGISWTSESLPAGTVLTTPLECEGPDDCVAGALLFGQGQSVSQLAPSNASSIVQGLLNPGGAGSSNSSCELNAFGGSGPLHPSSDGLSESETLAVLDDFGAVAARIGSWPYSNQCADNLMRGVRDIVAYQPEGEGLSSLSGEDPFSSSALASLARDLQSMTLYETSGMTAVVESTTDGGTSWSTVTLPSGTGPVVGLTCPTIATCEGLAWTNPFQSTDAAPWTDYGNYQGIEPTQFIETTDDGATWTTSSYPDALDARSLSCSDANTCVATGAIASVTSSGNPDFATQGLVLTTSDGGASWTPATIPSSVAIVADPTCPTTETCYATGDATTNGSVVLSSDDGGSTWDTVPLPASLTGAQLTSISCPTTTSCALSGELPGGVQIARGTNGYSFVGGPKGEYSPVSGPGSGPAMIVSTDDSGTTWTTQTFGWREADGNQLVSTTQVSCSSPDDCLAIGGSSSFSSPVLAGSTR
jgi:photosystem II stability/assembly factor-like uncharacterized protein